MTVHIIGAGLAGLSAAVRLCGNKQAVIVYEAAAHGGGRCRSFHDATLGRQIDNGNHLLLSGNVQAMAYVRAIGSPASFIESPRAVFEFLDLQNAECWQVRPGRSRLPLWLLRGHRRVPGSSLLDYLAALKLAWVSEDATLSEVLNTARPLFRKFWQPLCLSVLNTPPQEAAAHLLWPVLKQTFGRGEAACRPCIARQGLSESFIDPALAVLEKGGAQVHFKRRLRAINMTDNRAGALSFADVQVTLGPDDKVILAVPPEVAGGLLEGLCRPEKFKAIVNGHFLLPGAQGEARFVGLVGGVSQWLFVRGDVASVTVSAADDLAGESSEDIANTLWAEVLQALQIPDAPLGPYRIIKEKRATFAQTPRQVRLRPHTQTRWDNVLLAGDWTQTGLPATIEGAVTSGHRAADMILGA